MPHHTRAPQPNTLSKLPPNLGWFDTCDNDYIYARRESKYHYIPKRSLGHCIAIKTTILHHFARLEADEIQDPQTDRLRKLLLHIDHM
eukprot:6825607-Prorocentrum_lima.AAC.1